MLAYRFGTAAQTKPAEVQTGHEAHVGNNDAAEENLTEPELKLVEAEVSLPAATSKKARKAAKKAEKAKQAASKAAKADVIEVEAADGTTPTAHTSGSSDSTITFELAHKSLEKEEYRWSMLAYRFGTAAQTKPAEEMTALKAPAALNVSGSPKEEEPIDKIEVHLSSLKAEQAEKEEVRRLENCLEKADVEKAEGMEVHEAHVGTLDVVEEDFTQSKPAEEIGTYHAELENAEVHEAHVGTLDVVEEASTAASLEGGEVNEGQEAKPEELKLVEAKEKKKKKNTKKDAWNPDAYSVQQLAAWIEAKAPKKKKTPRRDSDPAMFEQQTLMDR